jgi:hypothetical protein
MDRQLPPYASVIHKQGSLLPDNSDFAPLDSRKLSWPCGAMSRAAMRSMMHYLRQQKGFGAV